MTPAPAREEDVVLHKGEKVRSFFSDGRASALALTSWRLHLWYGGEARQLSFTELARVAARPGKLVVTGRLETTEIPLPEDTAHYENNAFVVTPSSEEDLRRTRGPRGTTLLHHARRAATVRALVAAGLDPQARDDLGRSIVSVCANGPEGMLLIGYAPPPYDALDAMLEAGAPRPSLAEAREWLAQADSQVCSAGEASDATAFGRWLAHVVQDA